MKNCCKTPDIAQKPQLKQIPIALIGNPNSGKTTLFNKLTGSRQRTGNWPGVTVEQKYGYFSHKTQQYQLIDLPGTYSLDLGQSSLDEQIAREYVKKHPDITFINIVDASTLEKSLYLTSQLRERGLQIIIVLNMMDVANKLHLQIDIPLLSEHLGCPVIAVSLNKDKDISSLYQQIEKISLSTSKQAPLTLQYQPELEDQLAARPQTISRISYLQQIETQAIESCTKHAQIDVKNDQDIELNASKLTAAQQRLHQLALAHHQEATNISQKVCQQTEKPQVSISEKIDRVALGNYTGIPLFLLMMYLLFLLSINFGGAFIDFFDLSSKALLVDGFSEVLHRLHFPTWLTIILANGMGGGIEVVATFIPIIAALYLFLTLLEESGYMSRAAFVMDRFMRKLGVSGKAFVPLIIGFGCNVPAIMATRTMDSHRERITTVLMSPFMSCGARLTVFALFSATFFPHGAQNIVFSLYIAGIGFAVLTAIILKNTLLKGEADDFLMELPDYQRPNMRNVFINTWNKLKGFVLGAGKIIVAVVMVINVLNSLGTDGSFGNDNSQNSVLSATAKAITPVFSPMGITQDNWPATVGIMTGVLAKEVVVGTLDSLYSSMDNHVRIKDTAKFDLKRDLILALETIPTNLNTAVANLADPLGLGAIQETEDLSLAAEQQSVQLKTMTAMQQRFDGKIGAFAYMLFILLYSPCVAAASAMFRETGKKWAGLGIAWSTGLAYGSATLFYQMASFQMHPLKSLFWITLILGSFGTSLWLLFRHTRQTAQIPIQVTFG